MHSTSPIHQKGTANRFYSGKSKDFGNWTKEQKNLPPAVPCEKNNTFAAMNPTLDTWFGGLAARSGRYRSCMRNAIRYSVSGI